MCGSGLQLQNFLEAAELIYTNGCIDKLVDWIHSNLFLLGGVALGLAIPQVRPLHTALYTLHKGLHTTLYTLQYTMSYTHYTRGYTHYTSTYTLHTLQ